MRVFYIIPENVVHEMVPGHGITHGNLFYPSGAHGMPLKDGLVLYATEQLSDRLEKVLHAHKQVARLQHPTLQAAVTFEQLLSMPEKQFTQQHIAALAVLGITKDDTIWKLHSAAKKQHGHRVSLSDGY